MRYDYRDGVKLDKKRPTWIIWLIVGLILVGGIYWLINYMSPQLVSMPLSQKATADATVNKMESTAPSGKHLYLPQINVDLPISTGSDYNVLTSGAWQKQNVKLTDKGTAVICATGFNLGLTPWQTHDNSPFYNLAKLTAGDEIYADYENTRYAYKVTDISQFDGNEAKIKTDSDKPKLALYSCKNDGSAEAGALVVAEQVGKVTDKQESNSESSQSTWQPTGSDFLN